jgi:hypothetical protein
MRQKVAGQYQPWKRKTLVTPPSLTRAKLSRMLKGDSMISPSDLNWSE